MNTQDFWKWGHEQKCNFKLIFAYDISSHLSIHLCAVIFTSFTSGLDYPCTTAQSKGWLILLPLTIHLTTELWLFKVQFLYQLFSSCSPFSRIKNNCCPCRARWITRSWKAFPSSPRIHSAVVCFCGLKRAVHMQEPHISHVLLSSHIGQTTDQTN